MPVDEHAETHGEHWVDWKQESAAINLYRLRQVVIEREVIPPAPIHGTMSAYFFHPDHRSTICSGADPSISRGRGPCR
jgi:hypothetical protein